MSGFEPKVGSIEFLSSPRSDSSFSPQGEVLEVNVRQNSTGQKGDDVRRRRRRSSSAEDLKRLEQLRLAREEAEKTQCVSPRRPSSFSINTLPAGLAAFRTESLKEELPSPITATPAKCETSATKELRLKTPLSIVTRLDSPPPRFPHTPPAIPLKKDEAVHLPAPKEPKRIAQPSTLTRGQPCAQPTSRRRRKSSIIVPNRSEVDMEMRRNAELQATAASMRRNKSHNDLAGDGVEFISPMSPRAAVTPRGSNVINIDIDSLLSPATSPEAKAWTESDPSPPTTTTTAPAPAPAPTNGLMSGLKSFFS